MQVNKIAPTLKRVLSKNATKAQESLKQGVSTLGEKVTSSKMHSAVNSFTEGEGVNLGHNAFLVLISVFTLIPRLLHARDDDEKRETIFRDIPTILIICFGMKGIGGILSTLASKKMGLHLVDNNNPAKSNIFRKALGYFKEKDGVSAIAGDKVKALYTQIPNKDVFVNTLECLDKHNGKLGKVLTMDKGKKGDTLAKAIAELLPDIDFNMASSKEIIEAVKKSDNNDALQKVLDKFKNNQTSPMANFADVLDGAFKTFSSLMIMLSLGFGIPKMNEKITDSIHKRKKAQQPDATFKPIDTRLSSSFYSNRNELINEQKKAFSAFMQ